MNDLKFQGMILLLIGMVALPTGWYAMLVSNSLLASMLSIIVFVGGVGGLAFGYIFVKFAVVEGR